MQTQMQTVAPDYVSLVIEWDGHVPMPGAERVRRMPIALIQVAGVALAGIGALALAAWGIHRRLTPTPVLA